MACYVALDAIHGAHLVDVLGAKLVQRGGNVPYQLDAFHCASRRSARILAFQL